MHSTTAVMDARVLLNPDKEHFSLGLSTLHDTPQPSCKSSALDASRHEAKLTDTLRCLRFLYASFLSLSTYTFSLVLRVALQELGSQPRVHLTDHLS